MLWPRGEIANTLVPASSAPEAPVMSDSDPPSRVIWPPFLKVCFPAEVSVAESFAAL